MPPRRLFRAVYLAFASDPVPARSPEGRFHENSKPTTYLASTPETAWREVVYRWAADAATYRLVEVEVSVDRVADLTSPVLQAELGVDEASLTTVDHWICRSVARRLRREGFEAVWTYSVPDRPAGRQLVVFLDQLRPGSFVREIAVRPVEIDSDDDDDEKL